MVKMGDIVKAVNGLVVELFPDDPVYVNFMPKDFKRPSTLIEFADCERTDANISTVEVKAKFSLTCYTEVDGHYLADTERLNDRLDATAALFACGYVRVGDRCLEAKAVSAGTDITDCYIDLQLDYFDDRPGAEDAPPAAESIETAIKEQEE